MDSYKKIDIHSHILPESWPDFGKKFGYGGWIRLDHTDEFDSNGRKSVMNFDDGRYFRAITENLYSTSLRLKDMKRTNVDFQFLSTVPVLFSYWAKGEDAAVVARFLNDHLAGVVNENPDKFAGLGTVPMQNPELAICEMKRCKYELGFKGLEIGTHVNDHTLDDNMFESFWSEVEKHEMPIFIHPWDVCKANGRWNRFWMPHIVGMTAETSACALGLALSGVLERYPKLKICFAHGGGTLPYLQGRVKQAFDYYPNDMQTKSQTAPEAFLRNNPNITADTILHNSDALKLATDFFGEDSLLLGSDYPFLLGEHVPGELITNTRDIKPEIKHKLLAGNALRFFNCSSH